MLQAPKELMAGAHLPPPDSREKLRKFISVTEKLRGQARVRPIDKLDETCTNEDDRMMLVQHRSVDCVLS